MSSTMLVNIEKKGCVGVIMLRSGPGCLDRISADLIK